MQGLFLFFKNFLFYRKLLRINEMEVIKMKILNTEIAHIDESKLGFERWVDVTYSALFYFWNSPDHLNNFGRTLDQS